MAFFCFAQRSLVILTPQSNAFLEMASFLFNAHRHHHGGTGLLSNDSNSESRKAWE